MQDDSEPRASTPQEPVVPPQDVDASAETEPLAVPQAAPAFSPALLEEIRQDRRRGELLGPMTKKYGAVAIVAALGVPHVADSLGVWDDDDQQYDED